MLSILISLVCGSYLAFVNLSNKLLVKYNAEISSHRTWSEAYVSSCLSTPGCELEMKNWGSWEIVLRPRLRIGAVLGERKQSKTSLVVFDRGDRISVSGNTRIFGEIEIPEGRFDKDFTAGRAFHGNIDSSVVKASRRFESVSNTGIDPTLQTYDFGDFLEIPYDTCNSFFNEPCIFYTQEAIHLDHTQICGQVMIRSDESISVSASARLGEVILMAPSVYIHDGFSGSCQVFASDTIIVGEHALLEFPSSISFRARSNSYISFSPHSQIEGDIRITDDAELGKLVCRFEEHSSIIGSYYSECATEMNGTSMGAFVTNGISGSVNGRTSSNNLYNASFTNKTPNWISSLKQPNSGLTGDLRFIKFIQ